MGNMLIDLSLPDHQLLSNGIDTSLGLANSFGQSKRGSIVPHHLPAQIFDSRARVHSIPSELFRSHWPKVQFDALS